MGFIVNNYSMLKSGGIKISGNAPIDIRSVVQYKNDLYTLFVGSEAASIYKGMLVVVLETNEVYMCIDNNYPNLEESWKKISAPDLDISGRMVTVILYEEEKYAKEDGIEEGGQWYPNPDAQPLPMSDDLEVGEVYLQLALNDDDYVYINSKNLVDLRDYVTKEELNSSLNNFFDTSVKSYVDTHGLSADKFVELIDSSKSNIEVKVDNTSVVLTSSVHIDVSTDAPEIYFESLSKSPAHGDYYVQEEYVSFINSLTGSLTTEDDPYAIPNPIVDSRKTAYIYNSKLNGGEGAWQALDGNIRAEYVYFPTGVKRNALIGEHRAIGPEEEGGKGYVVEGKSTNLKKLLEYYLYKQMYKINFVNYDGTLLKTEDVAEGEFPTLPTNPQRPLDASSNYNFAGWDPEVAPATDNITYTATYTATLREFEVKWDRCDSNPRYITVNVSYGYPPVYPGEEPHKNSTWEYAYKFKSTPTEDSWYPSIYPSTIVENNIEYVAQFDSSLLKYDIIWYNEDGLLILSQDINVSAGWHVSCNNIPAKPETAEATYEYDGWAITPNGNLRYNSNYTIKAGHPDSPYTKYYVHYNKTIKSYDIKWVRDDSTLIKNQQLPYGTKVSTVSPTPTKDTTPLYIYNFNHWEPTIDSDTSVTNDQKYIAYFDPVLRSYDVKWRDGDNNVLQSTSLNYGTKIKGVYLGSNPTKSDSTDGHYSYTWKTNPNEQWDPVINNDTSVIGPNQIYTAQFDSHVKTYTVTWKDYDGTNLATLNNVPWGTTPVYPNPNEPSRPDSGNIKYTFTGWKADNPIPIVRDTIYTAQYSSEVIPVQYRIYTNGTLVYGGSSLNDVWWYNSDNYVNDPTANHIDQIAPGDSFAIGFGETAATSVYPEIGPAKICVPSGVRFTVPLRSTNNNIVLNNINLWLPNEHLNDWEHTDTISIDGKSYDVYEFKTALGADAYLFTINNL